MKSLRTKSLWLMIFACVLGFTNIESSNNKNKKPVKSAKATKQAAKPAKHVKHNKKEVRNLEVQSAPEVLGAADDHNIQVDEQPVQRGQKIMDPVIDSKIEQLKNGEVVQTVTTKQVVGNKVVTKTESWTWYDYAKAAALVAGVAAVAAVGVDYFANDSKGMNYVGGQAREGYDYSKQGLQSFGEKLNEGYAYGKSKLNDARTTISNRWYGAPADNSSIVADADQVVPAEEVGSQDMSSGDQAAAAADESASSDENMAPESTEESMSPDENAGFSPKKYAQENPKTAVALGAAAFGTAAAVEYKTGVGRKAASKVVNSAKNLTNSANSGKRSLDKAIMTPLTEEATAGQQMLQAQEAEVARRAAMTEEETLHEYVSQMNHLREESIKNTHIAASKRGNPRVAKATKARVEQNIEWMKTPDSQKRIINQQQNELGREMQQVNVTDRRLGYNNFEGKILNEPISIL